MYIPLLYMPHTYLVTPYHILYVHPRATIIIYSLLYLLSLETELLVLCIILKEGSTAVVKAYIVPVFQDWRQLVAGSESMGVFPPGRTR